MIDGDVESSFITVLFTDIVGSTELFAQHGDDEAESLVRAHFGALRAAISEHAGREVKSTGDGLMVAFGSAAEAVRCAIAMQRATTGQPGGLSIRVGIGAGEPIMHGDDLYGLPVIVGSRLCAAAQSGEVLASDIVRQIAAPRVRVPMRSVGSLQLKGLDGPHSAALIEWREQQPARSAGEPRPAPSDEPITVVIADDQRLLRSGFRAILSAEHDIDVVAEAADGQQALAAVHRHNPNVVLMDIRMPELDGLAAAEQILDNSELSSAVVMLTTFDGGEYVYRALRAGVSGYLLKDAPPERLIDAVRTAAAGDALIAPEITRRIIAEFAHTTAAPDRYASTALAALSGDEMKTLRLVARGQSNAEIADSLGLTEEAVRGHLASLSEKLGLRDRAQAVVIAYECGVVEPERR
jgi:DNA-binding NarL/FixJ family response regulator/class 3 adenylate cyclase